MDNFETQLRRYRPVGPPENLRHQISDRVKERAHGEWLMVAAALFIAALLYGEAATERSAAAGVWLSPTREVMIRELSEGLGGDQMAREEAEHLIELDDQEAVNP